MNAAPSRNPNRRASRSVAARRWFVALIATLVVAAPSSRRVLAQLPTGALYGAVSDPESGRLPGVTLTLSGSGAPQAQVSDGRGEFRFLGLHPGEYALAAALEGFASVEYPSIDIRVARNTTLEITMPLAIQDVVSVSAQSPLLDLRQISRGTHLTRVELDTVPSARDPWAIVPQTPGVLADRVAVGGTRGQQAFFTAIGVSSQENDYQLDGVQITDMAGLGGSSTYFDFDWFDQVQLATGGSDVTKVTAGVTLNLVTKRGTNEPQGSARYFITDESLQSSPDIDPGEFPPGQTSVITNELDRLEDYGLELGGPLRQDRLWLWGAAARNEIGEIATGGLPSNTSIKTWGVKLNSQPAEANSAVASWNWAGKEVLGRLAGPNRQPESTWDQGGDTDIINLEDTHVLSPKAILTGSFSYMNEGFDFIARGGIGPAAPEALLDADGIWKQNFLSYEAPRSGREIKLDGTYFFYSGSLAHELKSGGRLRRWQDDELLSWPGRSVRHIAGINFGFPDGPQDIVVAFRAGPHPTTEDYSSLWVQDTLSGEKWTANLGLRWDLQEGSNDAARVPANPAFPEMLPAIDFAGNDGGGFDWETVSPRLGGTYSLGAARQTLLRASFARFAEVLGTLDILHVNPMNDAEAFYLFIDGNGNNIWDGTQEPTSFLFPSGFDPTDPTRLSSPNATDPALLPAVTDEIVLGVEHAVQPELVVALHLTWRRTSNISEQRPFVLDETGAVRVARREDYVADRVLTGTLPDGTPFTRPTFALRSGLELNGGSLLVTGDREVDSRGITVAAVKRLTHRWMLRGFLHWADADWSIPESFFAFDDPTDLHPGVIDDNDGQSALQVQDRFSEIFLGSTWQAQLSGLYRVAPERAWGFDLSGNVYAREGYPLPYYVPIVSTLDGVARPVQAVEEVDDLRTDEIVTVDLRLGKEIRLVGDELGLTFSADLFNAFNAGTVLRRQLNLSSPQANFVNETLSPRVWRLGVRLNWG